MKRRLFLKQAGAVIAGGGGALTVSGSRSLAQEEASPEAAGQPAPPNVLLTSAGSGLARALIDQLGERFRLRLTGSVADRGKYEYMASNLDHSSATTDLVRQMDAIVHLAELPAGATDADRIDLRTRRTYNLLHAAAQEHVRLVVYLSSLETLTDYPASTAVSEDFRPIPAAQAEPLSHWLGEFACREFARQRWLRVIVLRLGKVVQAERAQAVPSGLPWVDERDAALAVRLALDVGLAEKASQPGPWSVFHIASDSSAGRFPLSAAKNTLGFQPRHARVES